jgi:hypothetical protein
MCFLLPRALDASLGALLHAGSTHVPRPIASQWASQGKNLHPGHQGVLLFVFVTPTCHPHGPSLCFGFSAQQRSTQLNKKRAIPNQVATRPWPPLHPEGGRALRGNRAPTITLGTGNALSEANTLVPRHPLCQHLSST